jgi:hypothetical protein
MATEEEDERCKLVGLENWLVFVVVDVRSHVGGVQFNIDWFETAGARFNEREGASAILPPRGWMAQKKSDLCMKRAEEGLWRAKVK